MTTSVLTIKHGKGHNIGLRSKQQRQYIKKLKTSQIHHIKACSKVKTCNNQNQTLGLWENGIKPNKSEVYVILNFTYKSLKHHGQLTQAMLQDRPKYE